MTSPTSSTSSISGLISGMDTTTVISQLMQIESQPQTLLKSQLSATQTDAAAYRDVNSAFAALATAAGNLTNASTWAAATASSSSASVSATATSGAQPGSVSFSVDKLAAGHSVISGNTQKWATATTAFGLGTLTLTKADNSTVTITPVDSDGDGTISLADAVTAINKNAPGFTASAINTGSGFQLQVAATGTGAASVFTLAPSAGSTTFGVFTQGQDAQITLGAGGPNPSVITSATNTFTGTLANTSFTVSQVTPTGGALTTVTVGNNPDAVANAVQSMVTAANNVLAKIHAYTDSSTGSTAPLKGDWSLISLTGRVLDAVSTSVGTSSAGSNGLQLTRDGQLTFDASAFKTALAANPALVQATFSGTTGVGADNVANTPDDTIDVDGVGARLAALANQASDSATGILTGLANGQDTRAKDIQSQIDAWTLRLQARQQTLTNQFTAMETALGTLKNQASWLTSQINQLPTSSKSN
ncbi:flagellar filament capping protein FliD [Oryzihumus sp.]